MSIESEKGEHHEEQFYTITVKDIPTKKIYQFVIHDQGFIGNALQLSDPYLSEVTAKKVSKTVYK